MYFLKRPGVVFRRLPRENEYFPVPYSHLLVMNYLKRHKIGFRYRWHLEDYERTLTPEELFVSDFYLPDFEVLIQIVPFGGFSRRKTEWIEFSFALWRYAGYKVVSWSESEVFLDLDFLFRRDLPEVFAKGRPVSEEAEITRSEKELRESLLYLTGKRRKAKIKGGKIPKPFSVRKFRRISYFGKLKI